MRCFGLWTLSAGAPVRRGRPPVVLCANDGQTKSTKRICLLSQRQMKMNKDVNVYNPELTMEGEFHVPSIVLFRMVMGNDKYVYSFLIEQEVANHCESPMR